LPALTNPPPSRGAKTSGINHPPSVAPAELLPHAAQSDDASLATAQATVPPADRLSHAARARDDSPLGLAPPSPRSGHATTLSARGTAHALQPSAPASQSAQDPSRSESATTAARPASRKNQPSATIAPAPAGSATIAPQQVVEQATTEAASLQANPKPQFQELPRDVKRPALRPTNQASTPVKGVTRESSAPHGKLPGEIPAKAQPLTRKVAAPQVNLPLDTSAPTERPIHDAPTRNEKAYREASAPAEPTPPKVSTAADSPESLPHEASVPARALPHKGSALDEALPHKPSAGTQAPPHKAALSTTPPTPEAPSQDKNASHEAATPVENPTRKTAAHTDQLPDSTLAHAQGLTPEAPVTAPEFPGITSAPDIHTATSKGPAVTHVESTSQSPAPTKEGKPSAPGDRHSGRHDQPAPLPVPASASHDQPPAAKISSAPQAPHATNTLSPEASTVAPTSPAAHISPTPKSANLPDVSPPTTTTGAASRSRAQTPADAETAAGHEASEAAPPSGAARDRTHASPPEASLDDSTRPNTTKPAASATAPANHPTARVASTSRATESGTASADSANGHVKSPVARKDQTTQSVAPLDSPLADPSLPALLPQTGTTVASTAETRSARAAQEKNAADESSPSKTVQGAAGPSNSTRTAPPPPIFAPSDHSPVLSPQPTPLVAVHEGTAAGSSSAPTAPTAKAAIIDRAVEDPGLSVNVMPHSAHLSITSSAGDLALHVRVRDGSADVSVSGAMAPLFDSKAPQVRTALAGEGLSLGSFATDQQGSFQGHQGQPESAPRTTDTLLHPTPRRPSTSEPEVRTADDRRIHVTA
jgi:hypothetical protein